MNTQPRPASLAVLKFAAIAAATMLLVVALIGWNHFGTDILLSAAASGLSWCF